MATISTRNVNERMVRRQLSKRNLREAMQKVIGRLVSEGIIESGADEEPESEVHSITDNNSIVLRLLHEIAGSYSHYISCDIERYDAYVEFDNATVIVSVDDAGYIYVSRVETSNIDDKKESASLFSEVSDCINKINKINTRLADMRYGRSRY